MSKKWLMYALVGGAVYYFLIRKRGSGLRLPSAMPVLPTDSMMPGSMMPAVQGVIKEGQELVVMQ